MSETLKAWVHWKRKEKELSEDDALFVKDVEDLISQVGTYQARLAQAEHDRDQLRADRRAFADETQKYRDAWLADQQQIEALRKERDGLRRPSNALVRQLFEERDRAIAQLTARDATVLRLTQVAEAAKAFVNGCRNEDNEYDYNALRDALDAAVDALASDSSALSRVLGEVAADLKAIREICRTDSTDTVCIEGVDALLAAKGDSK